jgi:hypothetical protein
MAMLVAATSVTKERRWIFMVVPLIDGQSLRASSSLSSGAPPRAILAGAEVVGFDGL